MFMKIGRSLPAALAIGLVLSLGLSGERPAAGADGVLAVTGSVPAAVSVDLDLGAIERMPKHRVITSTPWTESVSTFDGVLVRDLLRQLGITGSSVKLVALNDYSVTIPIADLDSYDVILAYGRNGEPMPVRDKGPLWVIYPLDAHPELNAQETHAKMIWQVRRMEVM